MTTKTIEQLFKEIGSIDPGVEIGTIDEVESYNKDDIFSTSIPDLDKLLGVGGFCKGKIVELYGEEACAKAQPLYSKVLTPTGWTTMGELEVGQVVCGPDGTNSVVLGIFPQGQKDVYTITFDDGTTTECCGDHLWEVYSRKSNMDVLSVSELIQNGLYVGSENGYKKAKYSVRNIDPISFDERHVTINPYLLGTLIGDGGLNDNTPKFTTADQQTVVEINEIIKDENLKLSGPFSKYTYNIVKEKSGREKSDLTIKLQKYGLMPTKSETKFIPKDYLYNSVEVRMELLKGLMDTDGTVTKNGNCSYCTVSEKLRDDFCELVRSLGIRATISKRKGRYKKDGYYIDGKMAYKIHLSLPKDFPCVFKLDRKIERYTSTRAFYHNSKYITDIKKTSIEECQCIKVSHSDSLYITDNYIPTHNTSISLYALNNLAKKNPEQKIAIIDAEYALDTEYYLRILPDVNPEQFFIIRQNTAETVFDTIQLLCESGQVCGILVDSISALQPKKAEGKATGQGQVGSLALSMSHGVKTILRPISRHNVAIIFINQLRVDIGTTYGDNRKPTGGNSMKFYATTRLALSRNNSKADIENGENTINVKVVKNKLGGSHGGQTSFKIDLVNGGIDFLAMDIDKAVNSGVIEKKGSWYSYAGQNVAQGNAKLREFLLENPEIYENIKDGVVM